MFEILFQFQGGMFQNTFQQLQSWGFFDVVIPFALIFAILYTVLSGVPFLRDEEPKEITDPKSGKKRTVSSVDRKNIRIVVALAISLMAVVPHVTGIYPGGVDIIQVINQFLPETALVIVTLLILLVLTGLMAGNSETPSKLAGWAPWAGLAVVAFLLFRAISPQTLQFLDQFRLFNDPSFQALIIAVLVFALVIWLVVGKKSSTT